MPSETLRPSILLAALIAALAVAPVAPEAGNILFLSAGGVAVLLLRPSGLELVNRPALWMPLVGLFILAVAYSIATGGFGGLVGLLFVAPIIGMIPLLIAAGTERGAASPHLISVLALCGSAGAAAIAIAEFSSTGSTRVGWTVANPIHFADLALSVGFLALLGVVLGRGPVRWLFLVAPLLAIVAVLLSGTRGAVVALVVMSGTAVLAGVMVRMISLRHFAIGAVVLVVVLAGAWLAGAGQTSGVQRVMTDIADVLRTGLPTDSSTSLRLQMYEGGLNAFLASPIVGHGPVDFVEAAASRASVRFEGAPHLHNDLADFAASGGILGLIAYFLFLLAPLAEALRTPDPETRKGLVVVSAALVLGYFVMGLTNAMFGILNLTVFYAAATLVVFVVGNAGGDHSRGSRHWNSGRLSRAITQRAAAIRESEADSSVVECRPVLTGWL